VSVARAPRTLLLVTHMSIQRPCLCWVTFALAGAVTNAQTTVLPFAGLSTHYPLLQGYGDRVTGPVTGGFTYGGAGTYTPHVLVSFGGYENGLATPLYQWGSGYNDLQDIVYAPFIGAPNLGAELQVTLTADVGSRATLSGFDLGNWGQAVTLPYVRVTDEEQRVLFEELTVALAASSSPNERNFQFSPPLLGRVLTLRVSLAGLGGLGDNVGLDNLAFGESPWTVTELGLTSCAPAATNSSGGPASIRALGDPALAANDVLLLATGLPNGSFGFFLTSLTPGLVPNPGGSQGMLCLGGAIGRYVGPGQIQNSGTAGNFELRLDLGAMPTPTGPVAAQAGQTWHFTAWFRDAAPTATSNFTDALAIALQ